MRGGRFDAWLVAGGLALAIGASAAAPALAAGPVPVRGGGMLSVEAVGLDLGAGAAHGVTRALTWVLQDASGTRTGVVPPTSGPAPDDSPLLVADTPTGGAILIWSRWDGRAMKLAWSRFDGRWRAPRDLTFGPGDDRSPAVGTSLYGSFLFWRRDGDQVLFAPFDPTTGRMFGAPQPLLTDARAGSMPGLDGGSDAPTIILGNCSLTQHDPCVGSGTPPPSSPGTVLLPPTIDGGTDAPVVTSAATSSPVSATSRPGCSAIVVTFPGRAGAPLQVVSFAGSGRTAPIARVLPEAGVSWSDAAASASLHFLRALCD